MNSKNSAVSWYQSLIFSYVFLLLVGAVIGMALNITKNALGLEDIIFWGPLGRELLAIFLIFFTLYILHGRKVPFYNSNLVSLRSEGRTFLKAWGTFCLIFSVFLMGMKWIEMEQGLLISVYAVAILILAMLKSDLAIIAGLAIDVVLVAWLNLHESYFYLANSIALIGLILLFLNRFLLVKYNKKVNLDS